jgi:hypothetical protein
MQDIKPRSFEIGGSNYGLDLNQSKPCSRSEKVSIVVPRLEATLEPSPVTAGGLPTRAIAGILNRSWQYSAMNLPSSKRSSVVRSPSTARQSNRILRSPRLAERSNILRQVSKAESNDTSPEATANKKPSRGWRIRSTGMSAPWNHTTVIDGGLVRSSIQDTDF